MSDIKNKIKTHYDMVRDFQEAMGQPTGDPKDVTETVLRLRHDLIKEEVSEIEDEILNESGRVYLPYNKIDHASLCAEIADLIYVTLGFAVTMGYPLNEMFEAIHEANMSKLDDNGNPIYREDGKIIKGPNYKPVDKNYIMEKYFKNKQ